MEENYSVISALQTDFQPALEEAFWQGIFCHHRDNDRTWNACGDCCSYIFKDYLSEGKVSVSEHALHVQVFKHAFLVFEVGPAGD